MAIYNITRNPGSYEIEMYTHPLDYGPVDDPFE
jgi:hypothetical protein